MPITNPHELSVVEIQTTDMVSAVVLGGLEDLQVPSGTETVGGATSGTLYSEHESISAQRSELTFTTVASLQAALDTVGLLGRALTAGGNLGLAAYIVKREKGGSYAAAGNHRRYLVRDGIIVPTSLRADFQADARLGYRVVPIYDGSNNPVDAQDAQSIPSDPTRDERFSLYDASVAGVTLNGATSVELDFGVGVIVSEGATGDLSEAVWPTHAAINRVEPVLTIGGIDPLWHTAANIPLLGKGAVHADTRVQLAKRVHGGTFESAASTVHMNLTMAGLVHIDQIVTASDKENGTATLVVRGIHDGTNVPVLINTGVALA